MADNSEELFLKTKRNKSIRLREKEERLNSDEFFQAQREEADIYATERDNLLDQAQIAFDCNDLPAAKELSDKAKEQHAYYEDANKVAADIIFTTNNTRVKKHEIDFHGLYIEETIDRLVDRLAKDLDNHATNLTIILGQGERNNDVEGEREVIMTVTDLLKREKISHKFDFSSDVKKCRVTYNEDLRSETPTINLDEIGPSIQEPRPAPCCLIS